MSVGLSAAQQAVNEQMRRALEEDQYSANGSIVDTDSDDDDAYYSYRGQPIRLDRAALQQAIRKYSLLDWNKKKGAAAGTGKDAQAGDEDDDDDDETLGTDNVGKGRDKNRSSKKDAVGKSVTIHEDMSGSGGGASGSSKKEPSLSDPLGLMDSFLFGDEHNDLDRDGGSIFGQTTGSSNSTWVECDKCKKWRRLRGVVDEKKLPSKWYCSMNKNDPERSRCSAPEEEYETSHTPESAADARTRKHLRVWVRRLQCNEQYESRQPALTRGKKRAAASSSKEPYEWVRCCNPSCGKWRALLRIMDAKTSVMDRTTDGEWYCVMNTWDEKVASCAAPQENLPAVGCPHWVMQDDN